MTVSALRQSTANADAHDIREIKLALVGNPNCGKTTLFNALTGANQYVGNWPGVTVEKKEGLSRVNGRAVTIVDLPGVYSLSPYSMEEMVARNFIVEGSPDAILNIVDATNLERNLYLTVQLLELEKPMVVALNFMDEVEKRGDKIDVDRLSRTLGVSVIPITARSGENVDELLKIAYRTVQTDSVPTPSDLYDNWTQFNCPQRNDDQEAAVADRRYQFIDRVVAASVKKGQRSETVTISDKIDSVVTHKLFAFPIFFLTMLGMFALTFGPLGSFFSSGVETLIGGILAPWTRSLMEGVGLRPWLISLVVEGIIGGVGGVLVFLPQIALLFLFLSVLEDSGYMARAAFIMDRLLKCFGLSGKAFIPMLMGFGCTVPAIIGARTMEQDKDRRMTMLLVPFMSCSARLPVYGLLCAAFFPRYSGLVVFSLYLLGLLGAVLSGIFFKKFVFRGESTTFLLELPPYRLPTLKSCASHVWERVKGFLVKAGTLILAMSVLLWFLQSFGPGFQMASDPGDSFLGRFGTLAAPALRPLGFGTWQAAVALLTGLIAKESIVSTLSLLYGFSIGASGVTVAASLATTFPTPAAAYAFLVFVLLYVPCMAAMSTMYREMNSLRWTLFSAAWQIGFAYLASFLVYQLGSLLF